MKSSVMVLSSSVSAVWVDYSVTGVVLRMPMDERLGEACCELHKRAFTILRHLHILALGLGMSDVFSHAGVPAHEVELQKAYAILIREVAFVAHSNDKVLKLRVLVVIKPGIELYDLGSVLV